MGSNNQANQTNGGFGKMYSRIQYMEVLCCHNQIDKAYAVTPTCDEEGAAMD